MKLTLSLFTAAALACHALAFAEPPPITLEHAWTAEQINWGLMQRKTLAENHGMLFHYKKPATPTFWAFNCYIDLSVAFIDAHKVIREIKPLYAHPEKMDPSRPVMRLQDLAHYAPSDAATQFYLQNAVSCQIPVCYVLEMNMGWFAENDVRVGDSILWDIASRTAVFRQNR